MKKDCSVFLYTMLTVQVALAAPTMGPPQYAHAGMHGSGTAQDPYQIVDCAQLQAMEHDLGACYVLMNSIDCSITNPSHPYNGTSQWNDGRGFRPIGNWGGQSSNRFTAFTGNLHGNGHTIRDLYINRLDENDVGLFGAAYGGGNTIRDVSLKDAVVYGQSNVGTLAGAFYPFTQTDMGFIVNCHATGSVTSGGHPLHGALFVGGLVGNDDAIISDSSADVSVTVLTGKNVMSRYIGGLVGGGGGVTRSYASGDVYAPFSVYVGGLVGYQGAEYMLISNCYSTGNVTGQDHVGGFMGGSVANISDSYSTGNVSGRDYVGGFTGDNCTFTVSGSFSTGDVSGIHHVGGFVGYNDGTIVNCLYNHNPRNPDTAVGTDLGSTGCEAIEENEDYFRGTVYPTIEPFASWDFSNVWKEVENSYPILKWQNAPGDGAVHGDGKGFVLLISQLSPRDSQRRQHMQQGVA